MRRSGLVFPALFLAASLVGGGRDAAKAPQAAVPTALPPVAVAGVAADVTAPPVIHPLHVDYSAPPGKGTLGRHFSTLQKSKLKLTSAEAKMLDTNGFVISTTKRFPTFAHGYVEIYVNDLPVFVSADSILDPVHRSYRSILRSMEEQVFVSSLTSLLDNMRTRLATGAAQAFVPETRADVDVYLAVARQLLLGTPTPTVAGGRVSAVERLVREATDAAAPAPESLFGVDRVIDFSQYKPRGHYAESALLQRYFRSMMWLGREDAQLVTETPDGERVVHRRSIDAMLAMQALLDQASLSEWTAMDRALDAFVGKRDSMSFPEVDRLVRELGAPDPAAAAKIDDKRWLAALSKSDYGLQRIASSIHGGSQTVRPAALARSFSPFGQRFVIDSEVFSHLVYDRLRPGAGPARLMPRPLDVAYTVFGNERAKPLLQQEIQRFETLDRALEVERTAIDQVSAAAWHDNLYNSWLFALRTLSPGSSHESPLPAVARSEAWGTRILNTQLASWAQLRHDTVLYAKQSYTTSLGCSYPDAYVEPYPEFFEALGEFARKGKDAAAGFGKGPGKAIAEYFEQLGDVTALLGSMATRELHGEALTPAQLKFINQAVKINRKEVNAICTTVVIESLDGWYSSLFYDPKEALDREPTIVDVHTQPTDASGRQVGNVLHVGTGDPQLMTITADTCNGTSTYVGLAFSYYEETTSGFRRLTDGEWQGMVDTRSSPDFLAPILASR